MTTLGWTRSQAISGIVVAGGALSVASALMIEPLIALTLVAVVLALAFGIRQGVRAHAVFLFSVAVLLIGYASLGRGFAYLGIRPIFVGEVVLASGFLAIAFGGGLRRVLRSRIVWILLAFVIWSAFQTLPYLPTYGVESLRDAVVWGYAGFAFLVAASLLRTQWWERVPALYARWMPILLLWFPVGFLFSELEVLPRSRGQALLLMPHLKPGDTAVQLAGAAAFLALGLYHRYRGKGRSAGEWLWWTVWLMGVVLTASQNRGGMVALLISGAVVLAIGPRARWMKIGLVAAMLGSAALLVDVEIDLGGRRQVSGRQLVANAASIVSGSDSENLSGTKEWRLLWWKDIVDYTVRGKYFWTGKGFGVNLATADGYQLDDQETLRSPHNGHMTILARAGVPGFALWMLLQAVFGVSLIRAYWRARSRGEHLWARLDLWVLGFWVAFLVNASFDVFLEGPQGGIWFWSLFGFGIATVEAQREGMELLDARGMAV